MSASKKRTEVDSEIHRSLSKRKQCPGSIDRGQVRFSDKPGDSTEVAPKDWVLRILEALLTCQEGSEYVEEANTSGSSSNVVF